MDTSNILNHRTVRQLLESKIPEERLLGNEAVKTLRETTKKLVPLLRNIATPITAPYVTREPYLKHRWWKPSSFRGVELVRSGETNPQLVLFIDEKGHFRKGSRGYGKTELVDDNFFYADVTSDDNAWKDFPFGEVISSLTAAFESAVRRRELALTHLRKGTVLLQDVRKKFGV